MTEAKARPELKQILSANIFFANMKAQDLDFLVDNAQLKNLETGDVVFRQGEHAESFYLLLSGEIIVEVPAIQGPSLQVQELSTGKMLGWSWLISPYRWDFQARATSDAELIEFDGKAILAKCEADPSFGYDLFKRFTGLMSERLLSARRKMMDQWDPPGFA